jgi:hypothetical protein
MRQSSGAPGPAEHGNKYRPLYVMLGIGAAIMLYVRFRGGSDYFSLPRETYSPPPNQPWPPAGTQRRPDLTGHAQKHLSGYRHPCLNPPPASFVTAARNVDAAVIASSRHRAASKPADDSAGQVGG